MPPDPKSCLRSHRFSLYLHVVKTLIDCAIANARSAERRGKFI
ncbi:hypothetical protein HanPSC8_Chr17g0755891 [Helianthus annuus]|nr:hypothetical protein HanPSC8_Chr17g0755891 [Helianthus annuus]